MYAHGWPREGAWVTPSTAHVGILAATPKCPPKCYPHPADRGPGQGAPTWGTKAESVGCAEAAAADPGGEGDIVVSRVGLVLTGRGHQAHVGVQLDQEPVLQHPHHHLNELRLQGRQQEAQGRGGRPAPPHCPVPCQGG